MEATPEGFREKGRFAPQNQPTQNQLGRFSDAGLAHPVIANGRLYIRELGSLWVYDIRARP